MSSEITWLHISDLHYCQPRTGWDATRVLSALTADLRTMQAEHGLRPDLVFFTGDVVYGEIGPDRGFTMREQFDGAAEFLDRIRLAFDREIPRENVFIVPGNHD